MPHFGPASRGRLSTCHPELQRLFNEVVKTRDCSILCGRRSKEEQDEYYRVGTSKVRWPNSKHNVIAPAPSRAVDVVPYPFAPMDWEDAGMMYIFVGYVLRVAEELGIRIRVGADWDGDGKTKDQNFHDLPHFELLG